MLATFAAVGVRGQPAVSSVGLHGGPASGGVFRLAEAITVRVTFERPVDVTGSPSLALTIGSATRQARFTRQTGTSLWFVYFVQSSDSDTDGFGVGASALTLNGGTIKAAGSATNATLSLGRHALANANTYQVNGSLTTAPTVNRVLISGTPPSGSAYQLAEAVWVGITFDRAVDVTGTPSLALTIGTATRQASYVGGSGIGYLWFVYFVQPLDSDADGIGVAAGALALNGGAIRIRGGTTNATLGLGAHAIANSASHQVNGALQTAPTVSAASIGSNPARGDTYGLAETIWARIAFDRPVDVTGAPQLALTIGSTIRQASYHGGSGTSDLWFRYAVQTPDSDTDGISVVASALALNGGTIRIRGGTTNATLGLGSAAIANAASHKVNGSMVAARLSGSSPATLNQGNLRGATLSVTLANTTYAAGAHASHFTLTTAVPGLTLYSVGFNAGGTVATLRLHYDGSDFDAAAALAVTVAAAGTGHSAPLTTGTRTVAPARWVNVSAKTVALTEGGGAGSYDVALESPPDGNVTVTVTSDNAAVTVGGSATSTTLTFTTANWATAQTVTVTPVDDNSDTVDELALVTNEAAGGGYATSAVASRTVRVTVADDDARTGTDYDTDDDGLIEISGHAQLNAMRWDLDGNGVSLNPGYSATTTAAFPNPAAGMGCPDGGDSDQTPDGCKGYELVVDIDLDTDGDGSADSEDAYWNGGDGWDGIGDSTSNTDTPYAATFRGNGHTISNLYIARVSQRWGGGLFAALSGRIESLGLLDVDLFDVAEDFGPFAGNLTQSGVLVGVYAEGGRVLGHAGVDYYNYGGLVGNCKGRIVASYANVQVSGREPGGLAYYDGQGSRCGVEVAYARGAVSGRSSAGLLSTDPGPTTLATVRDSYWDRQTTGQAASSGSPNADGLTTAELQTPANATDIYAFWDDYDLDGDGRVDADDAAWHFGQANQYPVLKWGGHATSTQFTAQLSGQTDTVPSYNGILVTDKTYLPGVTIRPFRIPAPAGGNGTYDYVVTGLLAGLVFDEDGTGDCMAARTVCGTLTTTTPTTTIVAVTVADADTNVMPSDRASLSFAMTVRKPRLLATPGRLALAEGGAGAYSLRLEQAPSATTTVAVSIGNPAIVVDSDATPLERTLTFTTRNWNTAQSVTVRALGDADAVDEAATIANAASGGGYDGVSASVRAVVDDDEATGADHDADNDGLIEIDSLAKLNAVRWDLDGDGVASSGNETSYAATFAGTVAMEHMGCPDSDSDAAGDCAGYELTADLDFDTNGDGAVDSSDAYPNWTPVGGSYSATFEGNGHTISRLTIDTTGSAGLFNTVSGTVRSLGLADVDLSSTGGTTDALAPLAVVLRGVVTASWASGRVRRGASGDPTLGGLVGELRGTPRLAASYSTAEVSGDDRSGGLVAGFYGGTIVACYATGAVTGYTPGGLVGINVGSTVQASYFAGSITPIGSGAATAGLAGRNDGSGETYTDAYFDAGTTGLASGTGRQTTSALQTPIFAAGALYANWDDLDVDGDGTADVDAWDFGSPWNHPALNYGGLDPASQRNDYDADGDGLIDISTLAQLDAVRWDVDGDGAPAPGATSTSAYYGAGAFFNGVFNASRTGLACPTTEDDANDNDCAGYELIADLDFDTDGDEDVDANDAIPNWTPVAGWATVLDGGGHVIENLTVSGAGNDRGLFATATTDATVRSLGLVDVSVTGTGARLGALAGVFNGRVAAVYATGSVTGAGGVGGLVAETRSSSARIVASYSTVDVECTANAGWARAGGLAARNDGVIAASYAAGEITGNCPANRRGGLVSNSPGTEPASYWDTDLTNVGDDTDSPPQPPEGRTTAVLQAPTDYDTVVGDPGVAIYAAWDDQDVDGDGTAGNGADADPWDFGLSNQHPILKYGGLAAAPQLDAQPDTAPTFGMSTVANKTFQRGHAIQAFQVPGAGAGNGVLTYEQSGLPDGLAFDADGTGGCAGNAPRTVCGTPTATTTAPVAVTITVSDSDSNEESADEGALTFTVDVVVPSAAITAPSALAEATLNGATVTVELTNAAFESGVTAGGFSLTTNPNLPGLRIASAAVDAGATSTALTLGYSGGGFDTVRTLSVTVADSTHTLAGALTTGTVNIVPTPSVTVSRSSLSLTEGGSDGTYTVALGGQPTATTTVTATSDDAAARLDTDSTPLTLTLTFTPVNWSTARTVTVRPQDDDDALDETATINHAVSPGYGATAASVSVTVEDDETAAIVIDADPSTATVVDSGPIALAEGATSTTPYTVRLSAQPTGTVTVTVTSADAAAATADTDPATGLQNTLSFTTGNWDTARTVWLAPVDDTDPNSEEVEIRHEANGGGYNGVFAILRADVADDDVGVIVDTDPNTPGDQLTALSLREGQTRTYRVRLSTLPAGGNVTVTATSSNAAITVSPGSLAFNAGNWQTGQTVTVRAEHDDDAVGEWTDISNEANGGQYSGETTTVRATAEDDEMGGADYDADDDNLIEIATLARLNAVRWDLDGDGEVDSSANEADYRAAFAGSVMVEDMGCLDGPDTGDDGDCVGYELTADLDFDTDNDGDVDADDDYPNWAPIGGVYAATFHGNGRVIANLRHSSVATRAGLFWAFGSSAKVRGLGLLSPSVTAAGTSDYVGALAGYSEGVVAACYVLGGDVTSTGGTASVGGLLGGTDTSGSVVRASYATAAVNNSNQSNGDVGGLVGLHNKGTIESSYAAGAVAGGGANTNVGGLVGTGGAGATIRDSYWDSAITSGAGVSASGASGQATGVLQAPTSATGTLYANWGALDVDGDDDADEDPWDFGSAWNYPALKYGGMDVAAQRNDYDADGDGLIEITSLAQLDAVRWDLDGDGAPAPGATSTAAYFTATSTFFNAVFNAAGTGLACPTTPDDADDNDCEGYELRSDLDFDTDGSGGTWTETGGTVTGDANDAYANGGMGWDPIGPAAAVTGATHFNAKFDGNGKIIDNLFVNRARNRSGLFAGLAADAEVVALGLPDARVQAGLGRVGALVGDNRGRVGAVWASGSVTGGANTGGLVGELSGGGSVVASYSTAVVTCAGAGSTGAGLVGNRGGGNSSSIAASYSTGRLTGPCASTAGFALGNGGAVTASYWDAGLSGIADDGDSNAPEGKATADLQAPTDYDTLVGSPGEAIYATWDNQDVDGDGATGDGDDADPWDFGRPNQHPILKYRGLAAVPQLDAQPDTAPMFATSTLAAMTFPGGVAIQPFLLPAVTAGNGAYVYTPAGLPAGLSLGTPNCATERTVCGTPTAATSTTVTVTVDDGDSNMAAGDRDAVTFMVAVPAASARVAGTVPTSLTETNLNGATVRVELSGTVFDARIAPSGFDLTTAPMINGLSIASATRTSDTEASLRLRFAGDFTDQATLLVRVLAATHRFGGDQDTGTVAVMPAAQVMLSATELTLEEEPGSTNANVGTYTVVLTGQPPGTATVTSTSSNGDVTVDPVTLTFDGSSWNIPTFVTVTAGRDDDAADDVAHITHAVQGIPGVSSGPRVRVAVNDDDVQGLTLATTTLAGGVAEGSSGTYTVRLDTAPTGPVSVAVSGGGGAVAVDADATAAGDQATLLFNAANWDTPQTVTARAREDDDGADGSATLTHDPSGADYGGVESVDVTFAVTDDDAKGADLSVPSLTVQENGTASYALVLSTEPVGGPVSVAVASSATSTVEASPPALTFTAENWDVPQTITLSGMDDANTTDDSATVSHTPTGADYGGVSISDLNATVADDDAAGLKVAPTSLTLAEGATATYSVRLNVAPTATTTVTVGGATAKLTADADPNTPGDQAALTFDAATWDTTRTVTVTAVADADGEDETVGLTHAVTGAGDYASVSLARRPGVAVRVEDGGTAGVVVSPESLAIDEGGTDTYEVRLSAPPASGTTTVAIASSGAAGLTVATSALGPSLATSTLLFDSTNWDTAQTVTVTAVADHDRLTDAEGTLTHAVSGYGAVDSGPDLPVRVANTTVDHDADADGLIEIDSLAKLNAMRWDVNGDGTPTAATTTFAAAFPNPRGGGVCPTAVSGVACAGFELTADLDFNADGGEYDNGGLGWEPVGTSTDSFAARFDGNGRLLRNLFVNRPASSDVGLFGSTIPPARVEAVGLPNARVAGARGAGALVGKAANGVRVAGSWSTGSVSGQTNVGGLVGEMFPTMEILASYSTAAVECAGTGNNATAGGLAGGQLNTAAGVVTTSWAAGAVTGACPNKAGLVGGGAASATASYWDAAASGIPDDDDLDAPEGLSTADLLRPTDYEGVYANWNIDLDGDHEADDPWDFGSSSQYPSLKWRGFDATKQFVGLLSFASGVPGKSFTVGRLIAVFEVPAAVGGEGTVRYSARGLPPGLVFDADGRGQCGLARSVCGTPSEAGTWTATVTARDGAGATAALTISMEVLGADAAPEEEPAAIPDEALREAVARALGRDGGAVTEGDLLSLGELDASWSGVSNLAGLSLATNLRRLVLGGNAVSDLSELSGLRLLAHLDLSDNAVSDLSALSGLTRLETLLLSGNRVSDISPLRGMAGLKALVLDGNAVSDLAHMVFLESLEELSLSGNPLGGLSPLCSLRKLKWLWLAGSGLSDIAELSCLSGLERLWLSDNAVENIEPLSGMRRLGWLDLERNAVSGVDALRRLEALARLRLGSNRVSDAGPLAANEGLGEGDVAGLRGNPLSEESIRLHVPALRERGATVLAGLSSPWFASAGDAAGRQSFVRLVNRSEVAGEALVWGLDDAGARFGPARLSIGAGRTAHFNSEDLELGNAAKGLTDGVGAPMAGDWRLEILSTLDLEAQTFLRAPGGPLSALHDGLPRVGETLRAAFLPAGRERSPAGALRVSNPTGADETVMAWGFDDAGRGRLATGLVAPAGRAVTVSASELERWRLGAGRGLGRGEGNWRLELAAPWPLEAQALAVGDDGRVGNLSGPAAALGSGVVARVPLFPPASATGRVGVARVWNLGAAAGEVLVAAVDDAGVRAGPVALALEAFAAAEFDSRELEEGGGPLAEGVGAPTRGSWRLELRAQFGARVHARAVGAGGYATGLLEAAPRSGGAARVSVFNPGSNQVQRSLLRLANDGAEDAMATIGGVDDAGRAGGAVSVTVPAGEALWLSAAELEEGGDGFEGSLGDGEGKWRLTVSSAAPLAVMSLVEDEQGALSNLSTPGRR